MATRKNFRNVSFEKMAEQCGCDQAATNWLKLAVDPFHDYGIPIAGIPDNDSQASVVQHIPIVHQITAPAGLAANETWSCHITCLPIASTHPTRTYYRQGSASVSGDASVRLTSGGSIGEIGTITVITHGDNPGTYGFGNASFPRDETQANQFGSAGVREYKAFSPDDNNDLTMKKLIAGGFEVHNDTAPMYKQGSVTVYSSGQGVQREVARVSNSESSTVFDDQYIRKSRQPPGTKAEAGSMPDARTHEAADGCYVPIRLGDDTHYSIAARATYLTESFDSTDIANRPAGYVITPFAGNLGYSEPWQAKHRPLDIETTGAYFSGLSPETTLTLSVKFVIELCPTSANPSLLYMASPTSMYCPRALELYHQLVRSLPPGVPVHFNDKGDWFRMATKVMGDVAPLISPYLSMLNPTLGAGVQLAGQVAKATNNAISKQGTSAAPNQKSTQPPPHTKVVSQPNIGRSVARKK